MRGYPRQGHTTWSRTARMRRQPATRASWQIRGLVKPEVTGPWRLRWTRPDGSSFAGGVYTSPAEAAYWACIAERGNLESCVVTVEPVGP